MLGLRVQKANSRHDALGRFTFGHGGIMMSPDTGGGGGGNLVRHNAQKDLNNIADILSTGKSEFVDSTTLGEPVEIEAGYLDGERKKANGKPMKGEGLKHIIQERFSNNMSIDDISALLLLTIDSIRNGNIRNTNEDKGTIELEKDGIVAILSHKRNGKETHKWILTGFKDNKKEKEATDAIATVNADHSYTLEFSRVRTQVGAVVASLGRNGNGALLAPEGQPPAPSSAVMGSPTPTVSPENNNLSTPDTKKSLFFISRTGRFLMAGRVRP